jgi:hypothetical protein
MSATEGAKRPIPADPAPRGATEPRSRISAAVVPKNTGRSKTRKVYNSRRPTGVVATLAVSIMNHCRECCGFDADGLGSIRENVRRCPATQCWLWPYRVRGLDPAAWEV